MFRPFSGIFYGMLLGLSFIFFGASLAQGETKQTTVATLQTPKWTNRLFNFEIERQEKAVIIRWQSRFIGYRDTLWFRPAGADTTFQLALSPLLAQEDVGPLVLQSLEALNQAGIDVRDLHSSIIRGLELLIEAEIDPLSASDESIAYFFTQVGFTYQAADFIPAIQVVADVLGLARLAQIENLDRGFDLSLKTTQRTLMTRRHIMALSGLEANTVYEYHLRSMSLNDKFSPLVKSSFQTRAGLDGRRIIGYDVDIQVTPTSATASWFTNRAATSSLTIYLNDVKTDSLELSLNSLGSQVHNVVFTDLEPGRAYEYVIRSLLVDAEILVQAGKLSNIDEALVVKTGSFRTPLTRQPLRLLGPPLQTLSSGNGVIKFNTNQISTALLEYGPDCQTDLTRDTPDKQIYPWKASVPDALIGHSITLPNLQSEADGDACFRYRIRLVTPDGDTLNTDPRGNEQWTRDLRIYTPASGDTLAPQIVEGPSVIAGDELAVVRLVSDIETTARVIFAPPEIFSDVPANVFDFIDKNPDGTPRFSQEHDITIGGLEPGTEYLFQVELTSAAGITTFEDFRDGAPKYTRTRQPPGGFGQFITTNFPDTQFPVILSGPTVSSRSRDTAVIEWRTDEPSSSEVSFGRQTLDTPVGNGNNTLHHKVVLSNLAAATNYVYQVGSTDAVGNGATLSAKAVFTTDPELDLEAPVILSEPRLIHKNESSATFQWNTDEEATGRVEFGLDKELEFVRSRPRTGRRHRITLANLNANTKYFFKIKSSDLHSNGPTESQLDSFITDQVPNLNPPALSNVQFQAGRTTAIVRWQTDKVADSFVRFGQDASALLAGRGLRAAARPLQGAALDQLTGDINDNTEHEVVLTNLEPGTTFFFVAGSIDRDNNPRAESEMLSFSTLIEEDQEVPEPPQNVHLIPGASQVKLVWDANQELDIAGYNVYRRRLTEEQFTLLVTRVNATTYTDLGVENEIGYQYVITALDRSVIPNESIFSAKVETVPTLAAAPRAPGNLRRQGAALAPLFIFDNAVPFQAEALLSYTLQVSTREDFGNVTASVSDVIENTGVAEVGCHACTAWQIGRRLDKGERYYWRVRAEEGELRGAYSAVQQFIADEFIDGDFNGDQEVNFDDFFLFAEVFGLLATGEILVFDLDSSGVVDFPDFFLFAENFGQLTGTNKRWARTQVSDPLATVTLTATGGDRSVGRRVQVHIRATQLADVRSYGLVVDYDPKAVTFQHATAGGFLGGTSEVSLFNVLANYPGRLVLVDGLARAEEKGIKSNPTGLLATLEFKLLEDATNAYFEPTEVFVARSSTDVVAVRHLVGSRVRPQQHFLGHNFPNPFNPVTQIEYGLAQSGPVQMRVYDILGRLVRQLVQEQEQKVGIYTVVWDGRNQMGRQVGNGVYFYRLKTPGYDQAYKMLLLR